MKKVAEILKVWALLFLTIILCGNFKYAMAVENTVKVQYVGVDHSPLVEGDRESFYLTAAGAKKVKYRVFLNSINTNKTEEITNGYTESVDATKPHEIKPSEIFKLGKYKLIIWVKEENSINEYDSKYIASLNCVSKDDNNRVYSSGDIVIAKDVYKVGEKVQVSGIKNISGMKGPYKYKLHVYDTETNKWILDNKEYRNSLEWLPTKPGTYVLVVWDMSYNSTLWKALIKNPQSRLYEGWKLKVITVKDVEKKPQISFVGVGHSPLVEGEREKFYLTSKYAEKVQYRICIINEDYSFEDITNGYTPLVDADKPYEISPDKKFSVGKHRLWIWVRKEKSLEPFDSSYGYDLNCVEKNDNNRVYTINDMDIEKSTFKVGEKVTVGGIKDISGMVGPYTYKLHIFNTRTNEWIRDNKEYRGQTEWIPTEPGTYVLDLWTMSSNSTLWEVMRKQPEGKLYEGWKLKVINVVSENDAGNEAEPVESYTEVNRFEELYDAIENKYDMRIYNDKVVEAYEKAKEIVNNVTNANMSDLEKELALHQYVVRNTVYDYVNYINLTLPDDSYTAYGTLIKGKAVCQGYADTMKLLLNLAGIEAYVVTGKSNELRLGETHTWNLVKVDGEYYHLDATLDDPIPDEGNNERYTYFNLSYEEISKDHYEFDGDKYQTGISGKFDYLRYMYYAIIDSPWIYFSNAEDQDKLYKMRLDGTIKPVKLNDSIPYFGTIDEKWIYYSNYSLGGFLYKIRKDGLGNTRLNNERSEDIQVQGDWILYKSYYENKIYKIRKDGTQRQLVN